MYHRIIYAEIDPWGMCVSMENFSEQLDFLKAQGKLMPLTDLVKAQQAGLLPDKAIALTFDDGYVDNFSNALPLLAEKGIPATIFITSCNIDSARNFWWDELETIFLRPSRLPEKLTIELADRHFDWNLGEASLYTTEQFELDRNMMAWAGKPGTRMGVFYQIWKALWPLKPTERSIALEQLKVWSNCWSSVCDSRRSMNTEEIRELAESPLINIGAHTSDHSLLPAQSLGQQRIEIQSCQQKLHDILNMPITSFAYPHGEFTNGTIQILRQSGFESALTVQAKQVHNGTDPMRLPRYGVKNVSGQQFALQLDAWQSLPAACH